MSEIIELRFQVNGPDDVNQLQEVAANVGDPTLSVTLMGGRVPRELNIIDPVTAVLIGAAVLTVAKFVISLLERLRDRDLGGTVIDLRPKPPAPEDHIYRDPGLQLGWIAILKPDGAVAIEVPKAPEDIWLGFIKDVLGKVLDTAAKIADAAKVVVGEDKVTMTPAPAAS